MNTWTLSLDDEGWTSVCQTRAGRHITSHGPSPTAAEALAPAEGRMFLHAFVSGSSEAYDRFRRAGYEQDLCRDGGDPANGVGPFILDGQGVALAASCGLTVEVTGAVDPYIPDAWLGLDEDFDPTQNRQRS